MKIRQDIQFLRGLAVILVVLFHLQTPFFENGLLGVDVFFVISGFLMAKLYDKGSTLDFYKRRIDRLFPAYAATIFITLLIGAFVLIPFDFNQLLEQSIAGSFFASNIIYWSQGNYFYKENFNPILNLWSLAVEVQFYLVVPFLYPLLRHRKWLFFAVFFASMGSCFAMQIISPKTAFFLMPFRVWEFLIGASVAWWGTASTQTSVKRDGYIALFFVAALAAFLFFMKLKPDAMGSMLYGHPAIPALVVAFLTALVINYGANLKFQGNAFGGFLAKIGDYSYSIYLVHFPIIVLLNYVPFGGTILAFDSYLMLIAAIVLIAAFSFLSYFFIEKRFSLKLNFLKFIFSFFVAIFVSAFFLNAFNSSRYNDLEKNIFSAWVDRDTYRCGKVFRFLNPTAIVCRIGEAGGGKKVLLLGNSHADSIKKVFASKAIEYGVSTFFVVENGPLMGSGPTAEQLASEAVRLNIHSIVLHYSNIYDRKDIQSEIIKLIKLTQGDGIKVYLIAPVPTYSVHVPQAMFENAGDKQALVMTRKKHFELTQQFRNSIAGLEALGVDIFDPSELLCPSGEICRFSTTDFKPYYFDSAHLTLTGSAVLIPLFERLLDRIGGITPIQPQ